MSTQFVPQCNLKRSYKKTGETTQLNLCQEKVLLLTKQLKDYEHC